MKKLFIVFCLLLFSISSFAAEEIALKDILNSETIAASGTAYSEVLTLARKPGFEGYFSIQPIFTGTGALTIQYQVSNDPRTGASKVWSPAVDIKAAAVSGTVYPYPAVGVNIIAGYLRIAFVETGGANQIVVSKGLRCVN